VDAFDYFRAIYASREVSPRALELTRTAAELNMANYTVWHHRRFLLQALNSDLREELAYVRGVIEQNPKNYQVWQHRRVLVEWLNDPSQELRFTEIILSHDAKNYHAWQHRQWAISAFKLHDGELEYVERLLDEDIRNNSAWNQRFFLLASVPIKSDVLDRELKFTMAKIKKVPGNESSWNYLRGLIDRCEDDEAASLRVKCEDFCRKLYNDIGVARGVGSGEPASHTSSYLIAAMVDLHADKLEFEGSKMTVGEREEELQSAKKLCQTLATEVDVIRKHYWNYLDRDLTRRFGNSDGKAS